MKLYLIEYLYIIIHEIGQPIDLHECKIGCSTLGGGTPTTLEAATHS